MNSKDYAKRILLGTCVYYTVVTFLILFLYFLINFDLSAGVHPVALITILPFAFFFSVANTIYRHTELPTWAKLLLHYVLTVGGAFVCLYLPNKNPSQQTAASMLLFAVFTVIYFVIMGIVLAVAARIKRVKRDEANYHSVYKK
ncbi:MAG: DUF3021 domain-containing protein [Ruminococcaceae bacterium]|nr:DUF3021 domain-containing protein [Oscillospiraceae bacterium]